MGCHNNITADKFPKQGNWVGQSIDVCFHYDTSRLIKGVIIRDDRESPNICIIKLQDGRYILASECMHSTPLGASK